MMSKSEAADRHILDYIRGEICQHCFPGIEEIRDTMMDEARIDEGLIVPS